MADENLIFQNYESKWALKALLVRWEKNFQGDKASLMALRLYRLEFVLPAD